MVSIIKRHQWAKVVVLITAISVVVAIGMSVSKVARGYTFPAGSGTGCTELWCTGPGNVNAGWKLFSLSGSGPGGNYGRGFVSDSSTTWTTVRDKCNTYNGITHAYIFVTQAIGSSSPYLGLNYKYAYPGTPGYQSANPAQARVYYDEAVAYDPGTASGTWGSTVAAFCYFDNPPWNVTVTSEVDRKSIEPGEAAVWTHTITNNGPSKTNKNITWQYQNRGDLPNAAGFSWVFPSGSSVGKIGTSVKTSSYVASESDIGKKICRTTSASPKSNVSSESIESDSRCVLVAKKPKVQIWGGDLIAGRSISGGPRSTSGEVTTSISRKIVNDTNRTFGSWVEYGIFAAGSINGTASGSMFAGDDGLQDATVCGYSTLSFTNSKPKTCSNDNAKIGSYYVSQPAPSVSANFSQKGSTISQNRLNPNSLLSSKGVYIGTRDGNLVIDGGVLSAGKSIILKVSGTVTIAGNLTNSFNNGGANYKNIHELSQLVIIANKIIINSNVVNVDAWLIADGKDGIIETCDTGSSTFALTGASRLTVNKCNNKLTINGPVMAKHLWLRRTVGSGAGASSGNPAEVFNLRADAYLWAAARSVNLGRAQTVYSTELPPRF